MGNAGVAQLVEQRIRNAQVSGSIPLTSSTLPLEDGGSALPVKSRRGLLFFTKED